jgi:hypothetical protein
MDGQKWNYGLSSHLYARLRAMRHDA